MIKNNEWVRGRNRERLYRKIDCNGRTRVYNNAGKYEGYAPEKGQFTRLANGRIIARGYHPDMIHAAAQARKEEVKARIEQDRDQRNPRRETIRTGGGNETGLAAAFVDMFDNSGDIENWHLVVIVAVVILLAVLL